MRLDALISTFRTEADDIALPQLWSDADVIGFLNEAQKEACLRARLLTVSSTITLVVDQASYRLPANVIDVLVARLPNTNTALCREYELSLKDRWHSGKPSGYSIEGDPSGDGALGRELWLDYLPAVAGTLSLRCNTLPSLMVTPATDYPQIGPEHHRQMIDWALHLAFRKRDSDTQDLARSDRYEARFTNSFGMRQSANVRRKHLRHAPTVVQSNY